MVVTFLAAALQCHAGMMRASGFEDFRVKGFTPSRGIQTAAKSNPPFHLMRLYLAWLLASRAGITQEPRQPLVLIRTGRAKSEG